MSIERYQYNSGQTGHLKQLLQNNAKAGKPLDYEILVDKFRVVPRTNNAEQFDEYEEFVTEDTQSVTIIIYDGNSKRNNRYIFTMKEESQTGTSLLSGTDIEKIVNESLEKQKKEWEIETLNKEKNEIKAQLEEAEEYIEKLEDKIQEIAHSKGKLSQQWGELASVALEGIIRRNAHKLANIPGASALAGVFTDNTPVPEPEKNTEGEATFRRVNRAEEVLEPSDKDRLKFLRIIQEQFNQEEFDYLMKIINLLLEKPQALEPSFEFIQEWEEEDDKQDSVSATEKEPEEIKRQPGCTENEDFPQTC